MSDDEDWDKDLGFEENARPLVAKFKLPPPAKDVSEPDVFDDFDDSEELATPREEQQHSPVMLRERRMSTENRKQKHLSVQIEKDEDDWSKDFQQFEEAPKLKITGLKVDPNAQTEVYDVDFDFGDKQEANEGMMPLTLKNEKNPLMSRVGLSLNRVHSSTVLSTTERLASLLKELLHKLSDSKGDSDRKKKHKGKVLHFDLDTSKKSRHKRKDSVGPKVENEKIKESRAIWDLAQMYFNSENYVDAMKHLKKAQGLLLGLEPSKKDLNFESELLFQMGVTAKAMADVFLAISYFKQAIDCLSADIKLFSKSNSLLSRIHFQLGLCHSTTENFSMAAQHFGESLKANLNLASTLPQADAQQIGKGCFQIGKCCKQLDMSDLSRDYLKKAIEAANTVKDNETATAAANLLKTLHDPDAEENSDSASDWDEKSASGTEEDWDSELGLEGAARPTLDLKSLGRQSTPLGGRHSVLINSSKGKDDKELIPLRYKLLDAVKREVEIVKYPKATAFYSMKSKEGHRFLTEEALEQWMVKLVSKHIPILLHTKIPEIRKEQLELKQAFISKVRTLNKFSLKWTKIHYEFCEQLYLLQKFELCWSVLLEFFVDIKDCNVKKSGKEQDAIVNLVLQNLYIACKLWKREEDEFFQNMLSAVRKFDPKMSDLVLLAQAETYAHHKYDTLDQDIQNYVDIFCRVYHNRTASSAPVNTTNISRSASREVPEQSFNEGGDLEISARALCDLHFILNDISPLTTLYRVGGIDDEEIDADEMQRRGSAGFDANIAASNDLIDPTSRMNILFKIYPELAPSFLKAKVAFALGHHAAVGMNNLQLAEQLFFECLYILDICNSGLSCLAYIVSELGTNGLLRFGEALLANFKYHYAALAFEAAIDNFKLRKKTGYFSLLRRLATIAKENDDYKRSIVYFREILDMYGREGKINEIRYVSEMISSLYLECGDFRKAEAYLQNAISVLPGSQTNISLSSGINNAPDKIDPVSFRLKMKLVDLYLDSYNYEKGIELLESLMNSIVPHGTRHIILSKLAKAFIKKRWFKDCTKILVFLEQELQAQSKAPNAPGGLDPNDKRTLKFWELSALNYFHSKQYSEALYCVDTAIQICPSNSLSFLAHYNFLRGKIFQALSSSTSVQFPTTLRPQNPKEQPKPNNLLKIYTCTGDLIQECIGCFDKSYSLFRAIGDDIHIAKTVANISQTYLERVFSPVALLFFPYNDLARLPHFEVSEMSSKKGHRHSKSDQGNTPKPIQVTMTEDKRKSVSVEINVTEVKKDFFISFDRIENPAMCALDICADIGNPLLIGKSYMNMAELRYLQGDTDAAFAFWTECKDQLFQLFMDGSSLLGKGAPTHFLTKIEHLLKRLTRFLFCFDSDTIAKHLNVIDAYLLIKTDLQQSLQRPIQHTSSLSSSASDSDIESPPVQPKSFSRSHSEGRASKNLTGLIPQTYPPSSNVLSNLQAGSRMSVTSLFTDDAIPDLQKRPSNPIATETSFDRFVEINEETAERIWGFFSAIKNQVQHYIKGKLSQEDLLSRNRKTLRKIIQVQRANEMMKQSVDREMPAPVNRAVHGVKSPGGINGTPSPLPPSFEEQCRLNPNLSRLLYVVEVDDYIIYYSPSSGQKRIQRIGGKEENMNATPSPNMLLHLNINLLANTDEYVSLVVSPSLTLDKILKYLCNKPYWETDDSQAKKKSFFGSFGRTNNTPSALKNKPRFVQRTKEFHGGLCNLLSLLGYTVVNSSSLATSGDSNSSISSLLASKEFGSVSSIGSSNATHKAGSKGLTSVELSLISFAKKTINHYDSSSTFVPLTVSTQTIVSQCFTLQEMKEATAENPLKLYLYLSSSHTTEFSSSHNPTSRDFMNKTVYFTQEMLSYLCSLIAKESPDETEQAKKLIIEMSDSTFSSFVDVLPPPVDSPQCPVSLLCSLPLQVFPWEMIAGEPLVRYFSLQDMIKVAEQQKEAQKKAKPEEEEMAIRYFSFYFSGGDKNLVPLEERRREIVVKELFHDLHVRQKLPSCIRTPTILAPFHSPLVKYGKKITSYKRQYKYLAWFDLGALNSPRDIVRLIEAQGPAPGPTSSSLNNAICLCSYSDLIESTEALTYLMRSRPTSTFVFVPSTKMKAVVTKLMKVQEDFLKPSKKSPQPAPSRFKFLMDTLNTIQLEQTAPIVVFNPPPNQPVHVPTSTK